MLAPGEFTDDEVKIMQHLGDAYNLYVQLDNKLPNDDLEFSLLINKLHRMILQRPALRLHPTGEPGVARITTNE